MRQWLGSACGRAAGGRIWRVWHSAPDLYLSYETQMGLPSAGAASVQQTKSSATTPVSEA